MKDDSAGMPRPPGFHWTLVLILGLVTLGIFGYAWAIVQARWAKKIDQSSNALTLYIAAIVLSLIGAMMEVLGAGVQIQAVLEIAGALVATFGAFSVKDTLAGYMSNAEKRPAYLSGLMTIFFGEVYLQYHMNRVRSFQRHAAPAGAR